MNNKTIVGIVIMAIIVTVVGIGGITLAQRMNDVTSQWSSVDKPVSVLEAYQDQQSTLNK